MKKLAITAASLAFLSLGACGGGTTNTADANVADANMTVVDPNANMTTGTDNMMATGGNMVENGTTGISNTVGNGVANTDATMSNAVDNSLGANATASNLTTNVQ